MTRSLDNDYEICAFGSCIGFENEADLYPIVTIAGTRFTGRRRDGNDNPSWNQTFTVLVPSNPTVVEIDIELQEYDWPDPDDPVDVNPNPGAFIQHLTFDFCSQEIDLGGLGPRIERAGTSFDIGGEAFGGDDRAQLSLKVDSGTEMGSPAELCDLAVTGVDLVQVLNDVNFVVPNRPAVVRVLVGSSFDTDIDTQLEIHVNDFVGPPVVRRFDVTIPACDSLDQYFFTDAPVQIEPGGNLVTFGAIVDPDGVYQPGPPAPPCMLVNDGDANWGSKGVINTRPLEISFTRFRHASTIPITDAEADAEALATQGIVESLFSAPLPVAINRDEDELLWEVRDRAGPWTTVVDVSKYFKALGHDRVLGLVPTGWLNAQDYIVFPDDRTGSSMGKVAPHFAIAEIGFSGWVPAHELGHTFDLSEESCDGDFITAYWECEDEYNGDIFPDWPFTGSGFDVPNAAPIVDRRCLMDNQAPAWFSANDFRALTRALAGETDPRILIVTGYVTADGAAHIESALGVDEGTADRSGPGQSPFSIVVRDAGGASLGSYGILPPPPGGIFDDRKPDADADGRGDDGICDGDADHNWIPDCFAVPHAGSCQDTLRFSLAVPWIVGGTQVTIVGPLEGAGYPICPPTPADAPPMVDLATVPIAEDAVPIELLQPIGELEVDPGEAVVVHWRLGGAAARTTGGTPGVMIAASYDGGQTWWPRAVGVQGEVYTLPNTGLAHTVRMRVKVFSLQDGLMGASADAPTDAPPGIEPAPGSETGLSLASEVLGAPGGPITFVARFPRALSGSSYRLAVYDVRGRLVTEIARGIVTQELLRVGWNSQDTVGRGFAAGIYICRLDVGSQRRTVKFVRL